MLQPAGADAVGPLLVFLDLLECQPEGVREIGLAHIKHASPHAHAAANMLVDKIESASGHRSPTACRLSNLAFLWWGTMRPRSASGQGERQACRIAVNVARLPQLLGKEDWTWRGY